MGDCENSATHVLVTGGAGYIGSHTCVSLLEAGYRVTIVDNFSNAKPSVIDDINSIAGTNVALYTLDLRDKAALERCFDDNKFDAVIHFAGLKAVGESVAKPLEYYDNNLIGTIALLDVMKRSGVKRLVFSSSATVYGVRNPVPFSEEGAELSPINPYGWTKAMIEQILRDLAASDPEWSICLLRYFNPISAHPGGRIGEAPDGVPNNLVPYVADVAAGRREKVYVFGDDYDTPDGTGVRDYLHVVDLAEGHIAALEYAREHTGAEAINLGTGVGYSVLEIIHAYEKACGHAIPYQVTPRRPGDSAFCYADTAKAQRLLGWKAKRGLAEMCEDSWRFAKNLAANTKLYNNT
ncbi:MAG: UDP-glucose 4-epimerase GalE [Oscillospiraceae bacterium]|nr:UDP-glucose 4-epimerase GalE [Oscillospiraceae bacterium]